jgi:hypothetical protein
MRKLRRRRGRQALQLARLLISLDKAAADVRPLPVRRTRVSVAK